MRPECEVCWGSHGCSLPPGHDGVHECGGENGCGDKISSSGYDEGGFRWDMYGDDSPAALADLLTLMLEAGNLDSGGRVPARFLD